MDIFAKTTQEAGPSLELLHELTKVTVRVRLRGGGVSVVNRAPLGAVLSNGSPSLSMSRSSSSFPR